MASLSVRMYTDVYDARQKCKVYFKASPLWASDDEIRAAHRISSLVVSKARRAAFAVNGGTGSLPGNLHAGVGVLSGHKTGHKIEPIGYTVSPGRVQDKYKMSVLSVLFRAF
jgi:hypothetical protein